MRFAAWKQKEDCHLPESEELTVNTSKTERLQVALAALKARGHRLTSPRKSILQVMATEHRPLSAEVIRAKVERKSPCDLATVYRNMEMCQSAGIVQKCMLENGKVLFELINERDHHHHIICRKCERTECIDVCLSEEIAMIATRHGFTKVDHVLELYGHCRDCQ
ncbi:MAG: transcriptional repressor [Opitutaceae bacterium]|nr:transcriptional repressor [Opitutaceae bacterium]